MPHGEHDDEDERRARNRFRKLHALSVAAQAKPVSELSHAAAKLAVGTSNEQGG
jgi:hypothetical protein